MKIFKLNFNYSYAFADIVNNPNNVDLDDFFSESQPVLNELQYDWISNQSSIIPDIAIIRFNVLCCNPKALATFKPLLKDTTCSKILIGNKEYYAFVHLSQEDNKLNIKKSKIEYYSTGDIRDVIEPTFLPGDYNCLFQIPQLPFTIFCSETFKNAVDDNHLTGLIFEECKVKSKSWLFN